MSHIGKRTREVTIAGMVFEVGSGIDLYDDECWKAWLCDEHGDLVEVGDGATREDAEANVIERAQETFSYE